MGLSGHPRTCAIANPNAPTGTALLLWQIEEIVKRNPERVVIIDEAYIDFGGESCVPLIHKYDNLLVMVTFFRYTPSRGRAAGIRLGSESLMRDLNTVKQYSINPYNVNRMTQAAGVAAIEDDSYYRANAETIMTIRAEATEQLQSLALRYCHRLQTSCLQRAAASAEKNSIKNSKRAACWCVTSPKSASRTTAASQSAHANRCRR
ncbi:MAG: aminotransferase class I/II-fold pyridoxal phosphate-dependent enzyme [Eubacteriales bacterium]